LGVVVAFVWLAHHELRVGPLTIRLDEQDASRLAVVPMAVIFADIAANYVWLANSGAWTPGDYRASQWFLALMVLISVVGAPLIATGALISFVRRHRRKN
jgi:hypothetical protein